MRGSRKFCQSKSNFGNVFFVVVVAVVVEGEREEPTKYHYLQAILGQPAKRHLNADDGLTLNAGLVAL